MLYSEYTDSLEQLARESDCYHVNPNPKIWDKIHKSRQHNYLVDWIHPNASNGIKLFSEAFAQKLVEIL